MKKSFGLALAACAVVMASQGARAGADVGSIYVAPQIQGVWLDDQRKADDAVGFAFSLGRAVSEKWNIEASYVNSRHDRAAGQRLRLTGVELTGQRLFYRNERISPFLSFGVGWLEAKDKNARENFSDLAVKYGVGVLADIAKNSAKGTNLQARGEIYGRRTFFSGFDDDQTDYLAGLGLQYNWGAPVAPPPPADSDGDGVPDNMDKCPGTPAGTPVNADGCPLDSDGDGVQDGADRCPNTPAGVRVNADGCPLDSDGDGVADYLDKCPNTPAGAPVDANGCPLDSDGDGVPDYLDKCPDTPKGDRVDFNGCSFTTEIRLPGVVFDTDKDVLRPESFPILDGAAATLQRYPELRIQVAGHTDSVGSDAYNLGLSQRRAATVLQYLKDKGVTNTLTSRGYGERQPVASNANEEGRQQNRRVVLRVLQ